MKLKLAFLAVLASCGLAHAQSPAPGVTKNEIVLGTIQDLSGPLAAYGKQIRMGMQMRVEEANELGGVGGRKIKLLVEDDGYDPRKAVLAAQKMMAQDNGIFAMVGHLGTAQNIAALPSQMEKNVINFFPIAAAREMYEPLHKLKFANASTYYDQMRIGAVRMVKDRNIARACIIYQDDDFGLEVLKGTEDGLKTIGKQLTEKTSYKRGATDFSSQVAKMKAANCELVVLGTIIRETVGTMAEAKKNGFNPVFLGSSAVYTDLIPKLGGKLADGLYATMTAQHPYLDAAEQPVRFWANKYKTKYNEEPTVFSVYGYGAMDAFVKTAFKTGPQLTTDTFVRTLEGMTFNRDMFGTAELTFSATKHLGNQFSRLSQVQDGRWKVVSDYVAFSGLKPVQKKDGKWVVESEFFRDGASH
ncbi:ABC transporter substrate-binding protein [Ramlibacter albus]|uniref:ABC transporter substrate-binding protein n=1 Tax=Ramlibacter albus TaxID=2079448 RepID=A0A923S8W8_9BURK|nr:ABC transporter substrate-binding protein [Ramlibacter albus]MBC5768487.1 ABC transporter substrate-binding protein [Ramlibacter albus]